MKLIDIPFAEAFDHLITCTKIAGDHYAATGLVLQGIHEALSHARNAGQRPSKTDLRPIRALLSHSTNQDVTTEETLICHLSLTVGVLAGDIRRPEDGDAVKLVSRREADSIG